MNTTELTERELRHESNIAINADITRAKIRLARSKLLADDEATKYWTNRIETLRSRLRTEK